MHDAEGRGNFDGCLDVPTQTPSQSGADNMSLLEAMLARRSRRFAPGMSLPMGPLAYRSEREPDPLREEEEEALAFAACGVTG